MSSHVGAADRFRLHGYVRELRAANVRCEIASVIDVATYWESFPKSYTPEQVAAAEALHVAGRAGFDSQEWADALADVRRHVAAAVRV